MKTAAAAMLCAAAFAAPAPASDPRSVIFDQPAATSSIDTIIVESGRDPEDRVKRAKPPLQRFRETLESGAKPSGLAALDRGQELPPGFDRYTPHAAVTAFRAGSRGLDY